MAEYRETEIERNDRLYHEALIADGDFSRAVRETGFADRWERGVSEHPRVRPAYLAKVRADEEWLGCL